MNNQKGFCILKLKPADPKDVPSSPQNQISELQFDNTAYPEEEPKPSRSLIFEFMEEKVRKGLVQRPARAKTNPSIIEKNKGGGVL